MTHSPEGARREGCPPWCRRDHASSDHPEDRRHRGQPAVVGATVAVLDEDTLRPRATATQLVVQRFQDEDAEPVWVQIATADATHVGLLIHIGDVAALRDALAAA